MNNQENSLVYQCTACDDTFDHLPYYFETFNTSYSHNMYSLNNDGKAPFAIAGICNICIQEAKDRAQKQKQKFFDNFSEESKQLIPKYLCLITSEKRGSIIEFYNSCKLELKMPTFYRYVSEKKFQKYFRAEKSELKQDEKSIPQQQSDIKINIPQVPDSIIVEEKINEFPIIEDECPIIIKQKNESNDDDLPDF